MSITVGFAPEPLLVPLALLLPSKKLPAALNVTKKFLQLRASIEAVGIIEPLTVTPATKKSKQRTILDGHIRMLSLGELGYVDAPCLEATDDESYTHNNRLNRLGSVQEHSMIRRAIERGVSPEKLARALNMDVRTIMRKSKLLDGICPEAVELLGDRQFSADISRVLRRMKPTRQIECVELMVSANNITAPYAEAMLVATPVEQLVEGKKPQKLTGVSPEQLARMEREMSNLQGQYRAVEQTYGQNMLNLVLVRGYLTKLLANKPVAAYLQHYQPDVLTEFMTIVSQA